MDARQQGKTVNEPPAVYRAVRRGQAVAFSAAALKLLAGMETNVKNGSVDLPDQVPVMPLPGAVLFPHALLPLYIFETRYREMLEHALQHDRMFSVALIKPSCPEWHAPEDFFHFATIGLIRACVGRSDGTSNLVLQGLHRVRFASFQQETPFPIAKIDIVESTNSATVETEALGEKVLELYQKLKRAERQLPPKVDRYLAQLGDLEMLADLIASTFVDDPLRRQRMLEEPSVNQRLRLLITFLQDEIGSAAV
jgi:Lon protease-like protein